MGVDKAHSAPPPLLFPPGKGRAVVPLPPRTATGTNLSAPNIAPCSPTQRCVELHTSTWAGGGLQLGVGGVGAVLASLAHSQLVDRTGREEEVLWVIRSSQWDKCPRRSSHGASNGQ